MFLDSGNIISDEIFCTQSQNYVEEVPEFSADSLCLRQGMVRYKEHTAGRHPRTAVGEHLDDTGHKCSLKKAKILDKEDQVSRRRIK